MTTEQETSVDKPQEAASASAVETAPAAETPAPTRYVGFQARMFAMFIDTSIIVMLLMLFLPGLMRLDGATDMPPEIRAQFEQIMIDKDAGKITEQEARHQMGVLVTQSLNPAKLLMQSGIQLAVGAALVIPFWRKRGGTPGKMILGMKIVDAETLGKPSDMQLFKRYLGYVLSTIPLGLGFLWIAFNKQRQAWHDMMAHTVVIYHRPLAPDWEKKKFKRQTIFFVSVIILLSIYNHYRHAL